MVTEVDCKKNTLRLTDDDILHMKEMVSLIIHMMKTTLAHDEYAESLSFQPSFAFELDVLFTYLWERNEDVFERDRVCQYGAHVAEAFRYVHQQHNRTQRVKDFDIVFSAFVIFVAAVSGLFESELRKGTIRITNDDVQTFALCRNDVANLALRPCPTVEHLLDEFNVEYLVRLNMSKKVFH